MSAGPAGQTGVPRVSRLVVTRPEPEATQWVQALRAQGWPAEAWPLITIGEPTADADMQALRHWRAHWPSQDALMFVSAAAVAHFFAGVRAPAAPTGTRFWAPGPGTARALAAHLAPLGIGSDRIDAPPADAAQFDSEHLWPVVAPQMGPGRRVLIVRGASGGADIGPLPGSGREWLIDRCRDAGAEVDACVAYARHTPALTPAQCERLAHRAGPDTVWLISSSEALAPLAACWPAGARATALVTHPRMAQAARSAGFAQVIETRPSLDDVVRDLKSWASPS